ncbi:MAG: bifunctional YncE family protein/alkaline phosphatase family protein [Acidobacteriota bacterium]
MSPWFELVAKVIALLALYLAWQHPEYRKVGDRYGNEVLVPSNQLLNPAGRRIEFSQRPVDMALSPRGDVLAVLLPRAVRFYTPAGQSLRSVSTATASSFLGLAFSPDGANVAISQAASVTVLPVSGGTAATISLPAQSTPAGLAFDPAGAVLYAALNRRNQVVRIDVAQRQVTATVDVGVAPLGLAITAAGDRLFVTNWGGRRPVAGEATLPSVGTATLADSGGVASSGTVSVIDTVSFRVIKEIPTELHPSGIQMSPDETLVAVANANSDSVSIIETASLAVAYTVNVTAFPLDYLGSSPTAVAFSPSGRRLYVACGGNNAVAVLELEGGRYRFQGFVPTDWYPVAVAVAPAAAGGDTVFVVNSKGVGSRASTGPYSVYQVSGTINIFSSTASDEASLKAVAAANDPFRNALPAPGSPDNLGRLGIRHVFLLIKENRTYDQLFGDLGRGNGDPSLTFYGWKVTPNQHELAVQFVTLDNFYCSGIVSADGHQWMTQGITTDYVERGHAASWPRSYGYDGSDPLVLAPTGFIWEHAQKHGLSVRVYGEFTGGGGSSRKWLDFLQDAQAPQRQLSVRSRSPVAALQAVIEPDYPSFTLNIPDVWRARVFIEKLNEYVRQGNLPNLTVIQLPTDHTSGTAAGEPTPASMVADNDLATGRIVEAIAASPYWSQSAIFVTEDDAQNGVDHVDGHRTVCLVASPYARRGAVDPRHYNQTSVLRTIEELLGLPPMNKFDAAALPMRSVFVTAPDVRPFLAVPNQTPLDTMNPPLTGLRGPARQAALDSLAMNFSQPDAAPEGKLNRILWHAARGWNTPYPRVPHHAGCRPDVD